MNDNEAFEKWWDRAVYSGSPYNWDKHSFIYFELLNTWQAACEYKQKEIDELKNGKGACPTCEPVAELNQKLQVENVKLRYCVEFHADLDDEVVRYDSRGVSYARQVLKELEDK